MKHRIEICQWITRWTMAAILAVATPWTASAQDLPDWSGIWIIENRTAGISGFPQPGSSRYQLTGGGAPWNETGRARIQAARGTQSTLKANGWGFPLMMDSPAPMQFMITPRETLIVNVYRDVRIIHTDGRDLPAQQDRWPTTWGTSVGRWEGDTLVVETVSVRHPTQYFFSAPQLSDEARYVERIRQTAPDRIESVMTIEDPITLTEPWIVELSYVLAPGSDRLILDDYANDRSEVEGDAFTIMPAAQ